MRKSREQSFTPQPARVPDRFRTKERTSRDYAHPSDSVLPTEHLRLAYAHIGAETGNVDAAIAQKRAFVVDIRTDKLIDEEIFKKYPTVYVGARKDIEFPLCLGSRTIMMVDPELHDPKICTEVEDRISKIITHQPEWVGDGLRFKFDFGQGEEDVLITFHSELFLSPEAYAATQEESDEALGIRRVAEQLTEDPDHWLITDDVKEEWRTKTGRFAPDYKPEKRKTPSRFEAPNKIGMLLGYRTTGIDLDQDPASLAALVPGGYILSDHEFASIADSLLPSQMQEVMNAAMEGKGSEVYKKKWLLRGFITIPLASQGSSDHYTFVRKSRRR
ncbi:hypothetical protein HY622_00835 [Candidatus Uhrbacteria bacterium]|nr:hypothetical protein [Candidatus Uhrbacteria bacterium]